MGSKWAPSTFKQRKSKNRAQKPIKRRSDKRKLEEMKYRVVCLEIDTEARESKRMGCYFCGRDVEDAEHHHLKGRDGDLLTEKKYIKRVHHKCHHEYHSLPVEKISWHPHFMDTLLNDGEDMLWSIEREKYNK